MRYAVRRKKGNLEYGRIPKNVPITKLGKSWSVIQATSQKEAFNKFAKKEIRQEQKYNKRIGLF